MRHIWDVLCWDIRYGDTHDRIMALLTLGIIGFGIGSLIAVAVWR